MRKKTVLSSTLLDNDLLPFCRNTPLQSHPTKEDFTTKRLGTPLNRHSYVNNVKIGVLPDFNRSVGSTNGLRCVTKLNTGTPSVKTC